MTIYLIPVITSSFSIPGSNWFKNEKQSPCLISNVSKEFSNSMLRQFPGDTYNGLYTPTVSLKKYNELYKIYSVLYGTLIQIQLFIASLWNVVNL